MTNSENNGEKSENYGSGYLEISEKGFGFLRTAANHYHPKPTDIFVTPDTIRRSFLREGSFIEGPTQPPHRGTSPQLKGADKINQLPYDDYVKVARFENLTTIDPIEKFDLETGPDLIETRVIDLVTPLGKGTRGLIVAPPRTGKTTILKQICNAITENHPEVFALVLLITSGPKKSQTFNARSKPKLWPHPMTWIWRLTFAFRASPSSAAGAWLSAAKTFSSSWIPSRASPGLTTALTAAADAP